MVLETLRKLVRKCRPWPDMVDECLCGHLFEEHDWGAYSNLRTRFTSECCVAGCSCGDFRRAKALSLSESQGVPRHTIA